MTTRMHAWMLDLRVVWAIGRRGTKAWITSPPFFVITLLFPLTFFATFSGALSSLADVEGFHYREGYTAFVYSFVILQAGAFGGVFTGYSAARDFDIGFAPRLFVTTVKRGPIIGGYVMVAVIRSVIATIALTVAAMIGGMSSDARLGDAAQLVALVVMVSAIAAFWSCGVAMRVKASRAGPLMYAPILIVLFVTPVYVPTGLLSGWLLSLIRWNPVTYIVDGSRSLIAGSNGGVAHGFAWGVAMLVLTWVWALRSVRVAERRAS